MASFGTKEPIHWCKGKVGKANPMQLKRKAISPAGNVVEVSLATGKTITSRINNPYAQLIELELESKDWIWYETCDNGCAPVRTVSDDIAGHCETCKKRELLIRTRQEVTRNRGADYAKMWETQMDKLAKAIASQTVANQAPTLKMEDLREILTAPAPEPEKKPRRGRPRNEG